MSNRPRIRTLLSAILFAALVSVSAVHADDQNIDQHGNWIGDIQTYARHCGEVVGAQLPSFNCERDGVPIPITINGARARTSAPDRCDRPSFNAASEDACRVGSRLGRLKFDDPDIEGVFICRRGAARSAGRSTRGGLYDEIAILQHNQHNGATCGAIAFSKSEDEPLMSGQVLSPGTSTTANANGTGEWLNPNKFVCGTCHIPDPFLFTPYVEQVRARSGERILPGFYDGPDGLNPRLWYPLSPRNDSIRLHRAVFPEGSKAQICTSCHALGATKQAASPVPVPLLAESLGLKGTFLDLDGRQTRRAKNPQHAWMHLGHPVLRPPFALKPTEFNNLGNLNILREITACTNRASNACRREPFRGRPPKAVEFSPKFALTRVAAGVSHQMSARQRNHDLGDLLRLTIRHANGRTEVLRDFATFDQAVSFVPKCQPGQTVFVSATMVRKDGTSPVPDGRVVSTTRRLNCVAPKLTRWLPSTKMLEAMPDMTLSGGLVGPRVTFPVAGFSLGDRNNREAHRLFLTFPIKPPVGGLKPKRALLRLSFEPVNGDTRTLGSLQILHYRFGSELTTADFASTTAPRDGFARLRNAQGVRAIDVTRHVSAAWANGDDRLQLGLWFSRLTDGDRSFDIVQVANRPTGDGTGFANFDRLEQPLLTVTFE